jgi:ATP-dependent DNA helicase PIF1
VTGATSYANLRTVDGDTLPSFREAAQRRGLLEADDTIDECLNEAAIYQMPPVRQAGSGEVAALGNSPATYG